MRLTSGSAVRTTQGVIRVATVAVIGGGAIGGFTAALLAGAGHDVTVCVRTPFDELVLRTPDGELRPDARISTDPAEHRPVDWVLLTTKAQDTAGAADWLTRLTGPGTVVAMPQNGLDHASRVRGLVDPDAVLPVLVYAPAERVAPGRIVWHSAGRLVVPEQPAAAGFAELFEATSVDVEVSADFHTAAWRKLLSNVGANALTALTLRRLEVFAEPDMRELGSALMREALAVARADGAAMDERDIERVHALWDGYQADGGSSMLYDRLAGRPMEHEFILGPVVAYAERYGVDVPLNRALLIMLRALDDGLRS